MVALWAWSANGANQCHLNVGAKKWLHFSYLCRTLEMEFYLQTLIIVAGTLHHLIRTKKHSYVCSCGLECHKFLKMLKISRTRQSHHHPPPPHPSSFEFHLRSCKDELSSSEHKVRCAVLRNGLLFVLLSTRLGQESSS